MPSQRLSRQRRLASPVRVRPAASALTPAPLPARCRQRRLREPRSRYAALAAMMGG